MNGLEEILSSEYFGNTVRQYLLGLGVFVALLAIFKVFEKIILKKLTRWAKKIRMNIDDDLVEITDSIPGFLYVYLAFFAGLQLISIPRLGTQIANGFLVILVIYSATRMASALIDYGLRRVAKKKGVRLEDQAASYYVPSMLIKIVLWSVGLMLVLSNLGVNISALAASVGIGGIAVALASQSILGDIFSSFSIYFDKPFEVGDFIIVGDHMGTVKRVGLKTTRITSLQGEEIVIPNRELTSSRISNFKKMQRRRIVFGFGVTYGTPLEKLKRIPSLVKEIIGTYPRTAIERVHLKEFADSSLNYEVVYYMDSADYNDYMDAQQQFNLSILEAFEKENISMAFPTRTLYINSVVQQGTPSLQSGPTSSISRNGTSKA